MGVLPKGKAWLLVELSAHDAADARARAERLIDAVKKDPKQLVDAKLILDREQQEHLWGVREAALGATAFVPGEPNAWPGLEDSAVPPLRTGEYLRDLHALRRNRRRPAALVAAHCTWPRC